MATVTKDLGIATAYGYAKSKGYTGTEDEFAQAMFDMTTAVDDAQQYAQDAEDAKDDAQASAQSIEQSAAQIATNTSDIADIKDTLEDKANIDGYYEDLTSGNAEQLISTQYLEDKVPYHFRASGGSLDIGNREEDMLVGGSIVWNQGMRGIRISGTINGLTFTNNYPTLKIEGTCTVSTNYTISGQWVQTEGHVYLFLAGINSTNDYRLIVAGRLSAIGSDGVIYKRDITTLAMALQIPKDAIIDITVTPQVFDLTAMFGTEVADAVYAMEQAEAGAGVAWFKKLFPNDYYEYNAGELMHVGGVSAHEMRDANNNIIKSYPLDNSLTLRGIPKIDVGGNLYYDGDTYESDGTVTRKYGIVDLGTLTWAKHSSYANTFSATLNGSKPVATTGTLGNVICNQYVVVTRTQQINAGIDKSIAINTTGGVVILDSAYTDAATFKTAMSGVYLVYELATPTTETAQPYQNPQIVDDRGTEEYVTTSLVPVGHETKYPANLRDKIQHLPDLASDEGNYIINQQGQKMTLVRFRIPSAPSEDGTYILRATVSNGTPTYTWESEAVNEG